MAKTPARKLAGVTLLSRLSWWLTPLSPALRAGLGVLLVLAIGSMAMTTFLLTKQDAAQGLDHYAGLITNVEANRWIVNDDTEIFIDSATQVHGTPVVGAEMTCTAHRLANERFLAVEIWVRAGPGQPPSVLTSQSSVSERDTLAMAP